MSHSTHVGFSGPPTSAFSGFVFCSICEGAPLFFASWAVGVGQIVRADTASIRFPPSRDLRGVIRPPWLPSVATGVGHGLMPTAHPSLFGFCRPSPEHRRFVSLPALHAEGVGHNPDSFPLVRCAGMDSSEHSPRSIIPHLGQVSDHSSKPARSEHWGVFHEHEARSHLANDSGHLAPQAGACSVDSCTATGCADVLAREAARDDIHEASPRASVEGSHVVPDREGVETSVVLSGREDAAGVVVELDGADGAPPEEFPAEDAAAMACE